METRMTPRRRLSILVPHAQERSDTCRFLFDSIDSQIGVDFDGVEVVVCDDGPGCPNIDDVLYGRKYRIRHVRLPEKGGVSAVRNMLMDEAGGEYIMFCDIDDGFCRADGLKDALRVVFRPDLVSFDVIMFDYLAERRSKNAIKHYNGSHVHAKFFRRKFIKESGVRWPDHITHNEDSAVIPPLIVKAGNRALRATEIEPFYIWKFNPESVTRRESGLTFGIKYFPEFVQSVEYSNSYLPPGRDLDISTLSTVYYSYCFLMQDAVQNGPDEYKTYYEKSRAAVAKLCADLDISLLESEDFAKQAENRRREVISSFGADASTYKITFKEWLDGLVGAKA